MHSSTSQPLSPFIKARWTPRNSETNTGSYGKGNAKPYDNSIHTHALGRANCPAKTQYLEHAKGKAMGKLNAMDVMKNSLSSPMPVEHTGDATMIRAKWMKYKSWNKYMTIIIDKDLDDIHVHDTTVTHHRETYTILHISADGQHIGSIHVKLDTGVSNNIMPLHVFQQL